MVHTNVKSALSRAGFRIVDFNAEYSRVQKYFSYEEQLNLTAKIRPWRQIGSREIDASAVANTFRLNRRAAPVSTFFSALAVFVTPNRDLVSTSVAFLRHAGHLSEGQAPPIVTDVQLAGLLWVAKGGAGRDIPRHKLIASCISTLSPSRAVVDKMRSVLAAMSEKDAAEFEILVQDSRCAYHLTDMSLGDTAQINADNAARMLEEIRRAVVEDVILEKEIEKEAAVRAVEMKLLQEKRNIELEQQAVIEAEKQKLREMEKQLHEREETVGQASIRVREAESELQRRNSATVRFCECSE